VGCQWQGKRQGGQVTKEKRKAKSRGKKKKAWKGTPWEDVLVKESRNLGKGKGEGIEVRGGAMWAFISGERKKKTRKVEGKKANDASDMTRRQGVWGGEEGSEV